jgi:hypothetical protein
METVANEELRTFYFLPNPYSYGNQINENDMGGVRDVIKPYQILVGKAEGQIPLDKKSVAKY